MQRESSKHGRRLDEEQKHEVQGLIRGGESPDTEEWRETEPLTAAGDEGPTSATRSPVHEPGSPEGLSSRDVDERSDLAKWISGVHAFPADRDTLLSRAATRFAPEPVLAAVRSLPRRTYANVEDVARELGISRRHD